MRSAPTIVPRAYKRLVSAVAEAAHESKVEAAVESAPPLAVQVRQTPPSEYLRVLMARTDPPTRESRPPMFLVRQAQ